MSQKLNDVAITDLSFSPEFTSAIERKQIAQQDAEKAKYIVQRSEQERLAAVIKVLISPFTCSRCILYVISFLPRLSADNSMA